MDKIKLIKPKLEHKNSSEEMKQEFFNNKKTVINGISLLDQMDYLKLCLVAIQIISHLKKL